MSSPEGNLRGRSQDYVGRKLIVSDLVGPTGDRPIYYGDRVGGETTRSKS